MYYRVEYYLIRIKRNRVQKGNCLGLVTGTVNPWDKPVGFCFTYRYGHAVVSKNRLV